MNCFSHRPNFPRNSCCGCREPPLAVAAWCRHPELAGYRQQPGDACGLSAARTAQRCPHRSPETQGESAGAAVAAGGRGVEPGCLQASLPRCLTPDAESAISPSAWQGHLRSFCRVGDIAWPRLHQGQAQLEAESQGKRVEIQPFPTVLQAKVARLQIGKR